MAVHSALRVSASALQFRAWTYLVLHRQAGCALHMSPATCPGAQVAVSPGRHVMLHAAQLPTAGALHDAPVSGFFFV